VQSLQIAEIEIISTSSNIYAKKNAIIKILSKLPLLLFLGMKGCKFQAILWNLKILFGRVILILLFGIDKLGRSALKTECSLDLKTTTIGGIITSA
jgi:hypothetical protein